MFVLIINPEAGHGKAERLFTSIQNDPLYQNQRNNFQAHFTVYPGHAEKLAGDLCARYQDFLSYVIVIGGDGTLHEVINGVQHYPDLPIGFIPVGAGNDFARGIGQVAEGVLLFRKMVQDPKFHRIRTGIFTSNDGEAAKQRSFLNSIGFGMEGLIVEEVNKPAFRKWTKFFRITSFIYPLALLKVLPRLNPISIDLRIDGRKIECKQATMVTITNHPYYGGGMKIAPNASIEKPTFHIIIVEPISKWKILALFKMVFTGQHIQRKEVQEWEGRNIHISSSEPLPFQVDGQSGECFECYIEKSPSERSIFVG
ncbi:diacylglycerol/lipid kinase family protein [Halobacillus halophilus]|uniref:diacylglycerol/lipid kinase family protein n=1 Tax=Halobacillus halophilus TaxID=1570 RepID=UPI001CD59D28|nr:diacylglycerol kinase family protein [Halobacillus halophilus]MCA1009980.1 diacylglycerol kinase family lipid kinase [Halobacillus halophilus]